MMSTALKRMICIFVLGAALSVVWAQKLITYDAGMGTRSYDDPDVWILYQRVKAVHEGMVLYADSALYNTKQNDFTAYGDVKIELTDTTTIYGDRLFYDANSRVVDIWDDTVRFIDGKTLLKTNHLSYDRNTSIASYNNWGWTTNEDKRLVSRIGNYNSDTKIFYIYVQVDLSDSNMQLYTDTLIYNMNTHIAEFWSPTYIYTDSATMYSERGTYDTDKRYAFSTQASQVVNNEKQIFSDTLRYDEVTEFGIANGHVRLLDTVNNITCTGRYGETSQERHTSFITDSALVVFVSKNQEDSTKLDTMYLHADSVLVVNDSAKQFVSVMAHHHVKTYRKDSQAMCDSAFYSVPDSTLKMFYDPVVWYDHYQCSADTIVLVHDSNGMRNAYLNKNGFCIEQLDPDKFNQVKGRNMVVYFKEGEPDYADILGNAEMVYYITEEDDQGNVSLIGVNVGKGSDMRIYFKDRAPEIVSTYGKPDMNAYPIGKLEPEKRELADFRWLDKRRPKSPTDVFVW